MKIQYGMDVKTFDGQKIGVIDQFIVNPPDNEVTHVVVKKGFLFTTDRTIPVSAISGTTDDAVLLKASTDLRTFPEFNVDYFVPSLHDDLMAFESPGAVPDGATTTGPLLYYPPISNMRRRSLDQTDTRSDQYAELPAEAIGIQDGAKVVTADGKPAGDVEAVFTDDLGQITHILVSKGRLFHEEKVLPISWVDVIDPYEVRLQVKTRLIEKLPQYHA